MSEAKYQSVDVASVRCGDEVKVVGEGFLYATLGDHNNAHFSGLEFFTVQKEFLGNVEIRDKNYWWTVARSSITEARRKVEEVKESEIKCCDYKRGHIGRHRHEFCACGNEETSTRYPAGLPCDLIHSKPAEPYEAAFRHLEPMLGLACEDPGCDLGRDHKSPHRLRKPAEPPKASSGYAHAYDPDHDGRCGFQFFDGTFCDGSAEGHGIPKSAEPPEQEKIVNKGSMTELFSIDRADRRQAERKPEPPQVPPVEKCVWTQEDSDSYTWSACRGRAFTLNESTPSLNGMEFCCFCGKPIEEELWKEDND